MTDNSFCIKVRKDVISILEKLEIFQEDAFSPKDHYAESVKEVAREGTHWDIIQEVWKTHSYDLLLVDNSIFKIIINRILNTTMILYCFCFLFRRLFKTQPKVILF